MDILTQHFVAGLRESRLLERLEAAEAAIAELKRSKGGRPRKEVTTVKGDDSAIVIKVVP